MVINQLVCKMAHEVGIVCEQFILGLCVFCDLGRSTANDLKMVVRLIKHDLRINSGAKHM